MTIEHRGTRAAGWLVLAGLLAGGLFLTPVEASGQDAVVQGILVDEDTSQPLHGVDVVLEQDGEVVRATITNRNGLFQIPGIRPGTYTLRIVTPGYEVVEETIELEPGEVLTASRDLEVDPVQLEGIGVVTEGPGAVRRELGVQTIQSVELSRIPTPAATGDLVSFLQTQPGVVGSGDRGGQLFIRGGTPTQNMVLMDGMLVYQPFHITGLFSTFPENLVQSAQFFPGGFGPKYTGRMSSVLDVQMRDGSHSRTSAAVSASPFLASASAEGPLGSTGRNSYIVSFRRSMIRETSPWLLGEEQPLGFNSQYIRLSELNPDRSSRCSFTFMRSRDEGGLDPDDPVSRVGWTNLLVGGRCRTLAGVNFLDVRFGRTSVSSEAVTRGASEFESSASRIFIDADASRPLTWAQLNWGGHIHVESTSYDLQELLAENSEQENRWWVLGGYGELEIPLGAGLRVLPGAAFSVASRQRSIFEPRLRASWAVDAVDGELNGAVGLYEQRLTGISDRRDASSVFTAWVPSRSGSRMRSLHAQASWEQSIGSAFSYSVDVYARRMEDLTVATWSTVASFNTDLSLASGRAHGVDVRVEYRRGPVYLFGGYGYSQTTYESAQEDFGQWFGEPVQSYSPPHDRRHQLSLLGSLELGRVMVSARWEYGSGFPFTRPIGFDEIFDFRTTDSPLPRLTRRFGQTRLLLDRPYNGRLPATHRLDFSVRRPVTIGSSELELQAGVINLYDQTNIFYYDVFAQRRVDQLPVAPYLSAKLQIPSSEDRP
ncbi:MAG: TonB-dependent receptor [Candidatus Longimicrobiales bacterium M2_2A_002]